MIVDRYSIRRSERVDPHELAIVRAGRGRVRVEVSESPAARSVIVHVNGRKVWPADGVDRGDT